MVAGDQKQWPPSTFFDRMVNDDDSEDADDFGELGQGATRVTARSKPPFGPVTLKRRQQA